MKANVRRRLPVVLCLALTLSLATPAQSPSPESQFEAANRLYEQGHFEEASATYREILRSGTSSAAVHYNLANACFRSSQLGHAIAHYRQAYNLAPRDPDIQANLRFAREQVAGTASVTQPAWLRSLQHLRLDEWTLLAFAGLCLTFGLLIIQHWRPAWRRRLRPWTILSIAFTVLHLAAATTLLLQRRHAPLAVALEPSTTVRYGPLPESQIHFTVPEGTELTVEDTQDGWVEIVDGAQRRGWTRESALWIPDR